MTKTDSNIFVFPMLRCGPYILISFVNIYDSGHERYRRSALVSFVTSVLVRMTAASAVSKGCCQHGAGVSLLAVAAGMCHSATSTLKVFITSRLKGRALVTIELRAKRAYTYKCNSVRVYLCNNVIKSIKSIKIIKSIKTFNLYKNMKI